MERGWSQKQDPRRSVVGNLAAALELKIGELMD
jgi:hypothetical protein